MLPQHPCVPLICVRLSCGGNAPRSAVYAVTSWQLSQELCCITDETHTHPSPVSCKQHVWFQTQIGWVSIYPPLLLCPFIFQLRLKGGHCKASLMVFRHTLFLMHVCFFKLWLVWISYIFLWLKYAVSLILRETCQLFLWLYALTRNLWDILQLSFIRNVCTSRQECKFYLFFILCK